MSDAVNVVNAEGEVEKIPAQSLNAYLRNGYTLDTPELAKARDEQAKYGSGLEAVKAFGEEALAAPTFGLSHLAEEKLGVSPEAILKRKQYNPKASMAGGISGLVGASLIPGIGEAEGAETLGALAAAPTEATSAIGELAGSGVSAITKKLLSPIGERAAQYGSELAGGAANSAAQLALYNAASQIDENHLAGGNFQQGVENALATTGDALKLGAGLHIVGSVGTKLLVTGAQKSLNSLQDFVRDEVVPRATGKASELFAKASSAVTGEPMENFEKYIGTEGAEGRQELLNKPRALSNKELAEQRDKLAKDLYEKLDSAVNSSKELSFKGQGKMNKYAGIMSEERSKLLEGVSPEVAMKEAQELSTNLRNYADLLSSDPVLYSPNVAKKTMQLADDFQTKLKDLNNLRDLEGGAAPQFKASDVYDLIEQAKSNIYNRSKFGGVVSLPEKDSIAELRKAGSMFKESLENESVWGHQAARQAQINSAIRDYLQTVGKSGGFRKDFMMQVANKSGGVDWVIDRTKVNTFLNKLGAARGERQLKSLNDFLEASQNMIEQTRKSGSTIGKDLSQDKYVQSLLKTADEAGDLKGLGEAHANIQSSRGLVQQGIDQQADQAKMRALANGPFVTGIEPNAAASSGALGPLAGAAAGATLGHVGLGGVGAAVAVKKAVKALKDPVGTLSFLAKIERFNDTTSRRIQSGINDFFDRFQSKASDIYGQERQAISYEEERRINEPYKEQLKRMSKENLDPVEASARYHSSIANDENPVHEFAPKLAKATANKQAQIQKWLWNEFPKDNSDYPQIGSGSLSDYQPSRSEMIDYYRKEKVATDPLHLLELIKNGSASESDIDTVKYLWPSIYEQIQFAANQRAADIRHPLSPKQKAQLSLIIGGPIDDSQDPQLFQLVQKNFMMQDQKKQQQAKAANEGLKQLSDDSETRSQRLQN